MLGNQPVVMFTFAGRQRYLELLAHYSLKCRPFVDKHALCVHTVNPGDRAYIKHLCDKHPDYFYAIDIGYNTPGFPWYSQFFDHFLDPNSLYVKLDDDIVWMEDGAIEKLVRYKKDHPELLVAFSNTVNNGICNHMHQRMGALRSPLNMEHDAHFVCVASLDPKRIYHCRDTHMSLIENIRDNKLHLYKFEQWRLWEGNIRFSINCLCITGTDNQALTKIFHKERVSKKSNTADDESIISEQWPGMTGRINAICGTSLVSHFGFGVQHPYLSESFNILDIYRGLIGLGSWRDVAN